MRLLSAAARLVLVVIAVLAGCTDNSQRAQGLPIPSALPVHEAPITYRIVHSFGYDEDGASPTGLLNVNGTIYGTTAYGGDSGNGTVFKITLPQTEVVLYSFAGTPDISDPDGGLVNVKGTFYGSSYFGGAYGRGAVFAITPSGSEKILYSFSGSPDGAYAIGNLLYFNGALYGTTYGGGIFYQRYGLGTIFRITRSGHESVLHRFTGRDGANPAAGLTEVNGTLYGTTSRGGAHGEGTVFATAADGRGRVLYSFSGIPDGYYPSGGLLNVNGTLYGTTEFGGTALHHCYFGGCGTVFSITPSGKERVIYRFLGFLQSGDGQYPMGTPIMLNGVLYGTTFAGGNGGGPPPADYGTVYSLTTTGRESVLHRFAGTPDGAYPLTSLVSVSGSIYGTTDDGGAYGMDGTGTVFNITL